MSELRVCKAIFDASLRRIVYVILRPIAWRSQIQPQDVLADHLWKNEDPPLTNLRLSQPMFPTREMQQVKCDKRYL